jgi:hypothetical protein
MKKRTERRGRRQAENAASAELAFLVEPMMAARQHLLGWVHAHGLAALDELFREEAVALAGLKGRHQAARTHHHWGTTPTELTDGQEATLRSVAAFRRRDPLSARMIQQLLARVSTRNYDASLEPRPAA